MAETLFAVNSQQTVKIWAKRLMREALKETFISRFMGESKDSLVYVKDELNKSAGDQIKYSLRMQLAGDGILGDATAEGNEEELTIYQDSILIDQLRHQVRSGGRMSEQRVPFSVREEALDGLRDWWAARIDQSFFNQICGLSTETRLNYTGNNTPTAPSTGRIFLGSQATSTTASFTATSSNSASAKGVIFQLGVIDKAINAAKIATPLIRPLKVEGQYKYVAFLHPNAVRQLKGAPLSTGQITWFDIMRARAEGGDTKMNPIYNGALGEYNGVILHESVRIPGLSTDGNVKFNVLCGAQAACFATGREDKDQQMKWVEELFDYENKLGVSAGMIWGLKKTVFNSVDFASIVMMSHSRDPS